MLKIRVTFCQFLFIGVLAGFTAASPTPVATQKSDFHMMFENNWPNPDPNINRFPHQTSCHFYYLVLSEDDISLRKCHDDKLFDYVVHKCVEKKSANCWSRHFSAINHNHHLLHKKVKKFKCPYGYGKFPDVTDCTRYFQCLAGKAKSKKCAPFEYFDKIERKCIAEIQAVCADETDVVEHGYKCPRTWGSFSFSKDCSKYYECIEKRPDLMTCPRHTLFDEKRRKCVSHERAHCGARYNPYEKTTTILSSPTTESKNVHEITEFQKTTSQESSPYPSSSNKPPATTFDAKIVASTIKSYVSPKESSEEAFDNSMESKDSTEVPLKDHSKEAVESSENSLKDDSEESSEEPHQDHSKEFIENHITDKLKGLKSDSHDEDDSKKSPEDPKQSSSVDSNEIIPKFEIESSNKILVEEEIMTKSDGKSSTETYPSTKSDPPCTPDTCIPFKDKIFRCPAKNGLFPHPEDDRHFLHCVNFKVYVKMCPYQLIFEDSFKACATPLSLAQKNA